MARSIRSEVLSFITSFKGLASFITLVGCFFFTCSYLLTAHESSISAHRKVLRFQQHGLVPGRHPLSSTPAAIKAQLNEIQDSLVNHRNLVFLYASMALKLKLENAKLVRKFTEISMNFTNLINKASHLDVLNPNATLSVHQFIKEGKDQVKMYKQETSKAKLSFESQLKIQKLKDTIFALNDQMAKLRKNGEFSKSVAAKAIPRNLHCLALRLMQERIENPDRYVNYEQAMPLPEFEDPSLYHYAIFSDNALAASVVVNSVVRNAKEPWKHVLHIVTDKASLAAMQVIMFKLKDYNGSHIEVKAVEDYKFLNSSYVPVLRQQESAELQGYYYGNGPENSTTGSSNLKFRNPKYLSILNHLRFYLPEMYPKLHKILFLDDDVVVQKDLTELWEIDMDGKVNGAVETCFGSFHRYDRYLNFEHPLISETFDPRACAWAYGMNIFDLDAWRIENCTEKYHYWQELNGNRTLWKLGTLPPGLITFYSKTKPLDKSWHVLGLGYNPKLSEEKIHNAAVVHFNGDSKPWLATAIANYQPLWTKYVDYDLEFLRACNIGP